MCYRPWEAWWWSTILPLLPPVAMGRAEGGGEGRGSEYNWERWVSKVCAPDLYPTCALRVGYKSLYVVQGLDRKAQARQPPGEISWRVPDFCSNLGHRILYKRP